MVSFIGSEKLIWANNGNASVNQGGGVMLVLIRGEEAAPYSGLSGEVLPKRVPSTGCTYVNGKGIHELKYRKGYGN